MKWLKEVVVDVAVTAAIILAVLSPSSWLRYVILGYSLLMLFLKAATLSNEAVLKRLKKSQTPVWVFHILYAVNVIVLSVFHWWLVAAIWVGIWGLSFLAQRKAGI